MQHIPVMLDEVIAGLSIRADGLYWDGTFGNGGHSAAILERLGPEGRLIGSDRDEVAERMADERFGTEPRFRFMRGGFADVVEKLPDGLDGVLLDLGVSTTQLKTPERGFSFQTPAPLDMRMDQSMEETAADLVNELEEKELADLLYRYGEERLSRRIAARILAVRKQTRIETTEQLAEICRAAYPKKYHRIDPATRTFQALRIALNDELGQVERVLPRLLEKLAPGGLAAVISFHSLEDRIVKHFFKGKAAEGNFELLTRKPLAPTEGEMDRNPASRSAKLRIIQFTGGQES